MSSTKIVLILLALIVGLPVLGITCRLACAPATIANKALDSAEGVLDRTLNPDNVIYNYEWFHDTFRAVQARVAQVGGHRTLLRGETDRDERTRLKLEIAAMQQSCRDMVAQYNANSAKINRSVFKGRTAPADLDPAVCE